MLQTNKIAFVFGCTAVLASLSACGNAQDPDRTSASGGATPGPGGSGTAGAAGSVSGAGTASAAGTTNGAGANTAGTSGGASVGVGGASVGVGGASVGVGGASGGASATGGSGAAVGEPFSFFVTSVKALVKLSGNDAGFGGDLKFGESGDGAGLRGADKICTTIAETSMPGNGKTWRAFLSATKGEQGAAVNAIDRVGEGPWYDRLGRLVAKNKADLGQVRPLGADPAIINDLPNEDGVPNHDPDGTGDVDNHDTLTGSGATGQLFSTDAGTTCNDWTSAESSGAPRVGHTWPRGGGMGGPTGSGGRGGMGGPGGSGENWMSALTESGCAPGIFLIEAGGPGKNGTKSVGDGGGYGGFYCFALTP